MEQERFARFNNVMNIILLMDDDDFGWIERHRVGREDRKLFRKKALEFAECLRNWDCVERGRLGGEETAARNRHNKIKARLVGQLEKLLEEIRRSVTLLEAEKKKLIERVEILIERASRSEVENEELRKAIKDLEERLKPKPRKPRKKKGDGK